MFSSKEWLWPVFCRSKSMFSWKPWFSFSLFKQAISVWRTDMRGVYFIRIQNITHLLFPKQVYPIHVHGFHRSSQIFMNFHRFLWFSYIFSEFYGFPSIFMDLCGFALNGMNFNGFFQNTFSFFCPAKVVGVEPYCWHLSPGFVCLPSG